MKILNRIFILGLLATFNVSASDGMIDLKSHYSVNETTDRFVNLLKSKGVTVFAVVDHLKGAKSVNLSMNQSKVVIFGNPKLGTKIMQCDKRAAIDLPMKALIWQDNNSQTWFSYNDMKYVMERHNLACAGNVLNKVGKILNKLSQATVK